MTEHERPDQQEPAGLSDEELEQEEALGLPAREAMSLVGGGPLPMFPMVGAINPNDGAWDTMPVEEPTPVDETTPIDDDRYPTDVY